MEIFRFKEFEPKNICSIAVGLIGASAVGAAATAYAASKAASAQKAAADKAASTSLGMYEKTREDLSPFREAGARASEELEKRMPFLTSPIVMDQETLEKTPGYQFVRNQGLKAVANSAAARGLGVSGAAQKGAATFATNLADTTYQTQFNLENINRTNAYDRLMGLVKVGGNAAAQTGNAGAVAANKAADAQIGAGNAQAAAYNATGNAVGNFASNVGGYALYKGLYGTPSGMAPYGYGNDPGQYNPNISGGIVAG